jgi:hypothetical protein
LRTHLQLEPFFAAYKVCGSLISGSGRGFFFEQFVHQWFELNKKDLKIDVCWSSGTAVESVQQLTSANVYWIPGIAFPNIDSAIVVGNKLYVLQVTIQNDHKFYRGTFKENFVSPVAKNILIKSVDLLVVVPDRVYRRVDTFADRFDLEEIVDRRVDTYADRLDLEELEIDEIRIPFTCDVHKVAMDSWESMSNSLQKLRFLLPK